MPLFDAYFIRRFSTLLLLLLLHYLGEPRLLSGRRIAMDDPRPGGPVERADGGGVGGGGFSGAAGASDALDAGPERGTQRPIVGGAGAGLTQGFLGGFDARHGYGSPK